MTEEEKKKYEEFFSDKEGRIEIKVSATIPDNLLGTSITTQNTTITIESVQCAFVTLSKKYNHFEGSGWNFNLYSVNNTAQVPYKLLLEQFKNTEKTYENLSEFNGAWSTRKFDYLDAALRETTQMNPTNFKLFSDATPNLSEKFNEILPNGINIITLGSSGGLLNQAEQILLDKINRPKNKVVISTQVAISGVPYYAELGAGEFYTIYEPPYESVSSEIVIPYSESFGRQGDFSQPYTSRNYFLMNMLSDFSYTEADGDENPEDKLEIVVTLDGKTNPNIHCSWSATQKFDKDNPEGKDLSVYNVQIRAQTHGWDSLVDVVLGNFPLMGSTGANFLYTDLAKKLASSVLNPNPTLDSINLVFSCPWLSGEEWTATVPRKVAEGNFPVESYSTPNHVPRITTRLSSSGSDGDNTDEGDGGKGDDPTSGGGSGVNPHGLLTKTYVMSPTRLQQLGAFLWTGSFFDNIKLLTNSPIENLLAVKLFAFTMSGTEKEIVIGNVESGVYGELIPNNASYSHVFGTLHCNKKYNNFLDFAPYTNLYLYLPYFGVAEIDTSLYMDRDIQIEYVIDVVVGDATINVYSNGILTNQYACNVSVDIPITASNRGQLENAFIGNMLRSGISQNPLGTVDALVQGALSQNHYTTTGALSSASAMYSYNAPMLIYSRPSYQDVLGYSHTVGNVCMQNAVIKTIRGFTKMGENLDLTNIPCTKKEMEEIKSILSSGFYA